MNRKTVLTLDHRLTFTTGLSSALVRHELLTVVSANIQHIVNTNIWPSARTVARFMILDHYEWLRWFNYYWLSFELVIWSTFPRIDPCIRTSLLCVWIRITRFTVICDRVYHIVYVAMRYGPYHIIWYIWYVTSNVSLKRKIYSIPLPPWRST